MRFRVDACGANDASSRCRRCSSNEHASSSATTICTTYHLPLTVSIPAREWLEIVARSAESTMGARGHEFRAFTEREWSTAMDALSESNPLFVFREGAAWGWVESLDTAMLILSRRCGAWYQEAPLLQPAAYTQADVDGMVSFILKRGYN